MNTTETTDYELEICPDCACWIANADDSGLDNLPEDEAHEARSARDAGLAEWAEYVLTVTDGETAFSSRRCDICDGLPGARLTAEAWMPPTPVRATFDPDAKAATVAHDPQDIAVGSPAVWRSAVRVVFYDPGAPDFRVDLSVPGTADSHADRRDAARRVHDWMRDNFPEAAEHFPRP